jgi:hypothetical protein
MSSQTGIALRRQSTVRGPLPRATSVWFVLVFGLGAASAPAFGVPLMLFALVYFKRAHPILRKLGLIIAIVFTVYAVLFLFDMVQFIYWQ